MIPPAVEARCGGLPGLHAAMVGLGVTLSQELTGQGVHAENGTGGCSVDLHEGESATGVSTSREDSLELLGHIWAADTPDQHSGNEQLHRLSQPAYNTQAALHFVHPRRGPFRELPQ